MREEHPKIAPSGQVAGGLHGGPGHTFQPGQGGSKPPEQTQCWVMAGGEGVQPTEGVRGVPRVTELFRWFGLIRVLRWALIIGNTQKGAKNEQAGAAHRPGRPPNWGVSCPCARASTPQGLGPEPPVGFGDILGYLAPIAILGAPSLCATLHYWWIPPSEWRRHTSLALF